MQSTCRSSEIILPAPCVRPTSHSDDTLVSSINKSRRSWHSESPASLSLASCDANLGCHSTYAPARRGRRKLQAKPCSSTRVLRGARRPPEQILGGVDRTGDRPKDRWAANEAVVRRRLDAEPTHCPAEWRVRVALRASATRAAAPLFERPHIITPRRRSQQDDQEEGLRSRKLKSTRGRGTRRRGRSTHTHKMSRRRGTRTQARRKEQNKGWAEERGGRTWTGQYQQGRHDQADGVNKKPQVHVRRRGMWSRTRCD